MLASPTLSVFRAHSGEPEAPTEGCVDAFRPSGGLQGFTALRVLRSALKRQELGKNRSFGSLSIIYTHTCRHNLICISDTRMLVALSRVVVASLFNVLLQTVLPFTLNLQKHVKPYRTR